jgi:hypothetical protein
METFCLQDFRAYVYGTRQINATVAYMSIAYEELKTKNIFLQRNLCCTNTLKQLTINPLGSKNCRNRIECHIQNFERSGIELCLHWSVSINLSLSIIIIHCILILTVASSLIMALQIPHATAQASGGEEIFECSGDEEDQRILSEEKSIDRLSNYRESVRAKVVQQSDENGLISSQSITPSEAFEVFQG